MNTREKAAEIVDFVIEYQAANREGVIQFVRLAIEQIRADQAERMNAIEAGRHPDAKVRG